MRLLASVWLICCFSSASGLRLPTPATIVGSSTSRRSAIAAAASTLLLASKASAELTDEAAAPPNLYRENNKVKLAEMGIVEEGDLVAELLRRTEANKEANAAAVRRATEANAFTAIDGTVDRRLVKGLDGQNRYLDAKAVRDLTRQRRLACAPSVMEPCREVEPGYGSATELQLPEMKKLECDSDGRNCKFRSS